MGRVIGHGTIGTIRIATCLKALTTGAQVAVRSVPKSALENNLSFFREELTLFRLLDHPNILRYYETFESDRFIHIVTEYCSGSSLSDRMATNGPMCERNVRDRFENLVRTVLHIHSVGLCHRDLRPQNIVYMGSEADAEFKIVDFCDMIFAQVKTLAHSFSNCTDFMAPELLKNEVCKESDIWSLGAILYFLLSGELPFDNKEPAAQLYNIIAGNFSFDGEIWETISSGAIDLIKSMIVVEPSKRLSLEEVLQDSWLTTRETALMSPNIITKSLQNAKPGNKLQREMMRTVVKHLSPKATKTLTVKDIQRAFKALDVDKTGLLSVAAMKSAIGYMGEEAESLNRVLEEIKTADGFVRYTDFLSAAINCQKVLNADIMYLVFKRFDRDDDDLLTVEEVHSALANTGSSITIEEVKTLLLPFDQNADQLISFQEFKTIFNDH